MSLKYSILTLGVFVMLSFQVQALNDREAFKEARKTCMEELEITPPEKGEKPSKEVREKIRSCLQAKGISKPAHHRRHKKMKMAMDECIKETGVARPQKGTPPEESDRAKLKACLESKGIKKPGGA